MCAYSYICSEHIEHIELRTQHCRTAFVCHAPMQNAVMQSACKAEIYLSTVVSSSSRSTTAMPPCSLKHTAHRHRRTARTLVD